MDHGHVEECPLGEREIGDRVPVVEAFHVRPVLLGIDRSALSCTKCHLTIECLREDLVEITLVTGDSGAIGEAMRTGGTVAAGRAGSMKVARKSKRRGH